MTGRTKTLAVAGGVAVLIIAGIGFARVLGGSEGPAPTSERRWVEVERVRSGDKVVVDPDDDLKYAGIRAPFSDEPLFEQATKRNAELVAEKKLRLRFDEQERDHKERLIGYAFQGDVFVNQTLVREGLAFVRLTDTTQRYAQQLLAAQAEARSRKRGLWSLRCTPSADSFVADPKYGNFHTPDCEELSRKPANRLTNLRSLDEAFGRGFAPCHKCRPAQFSE